MVVRWALAATVLLIRQLKFVYLSAASIYEGSVLGLAFSLGIVCLPNVPLYVLAYFGLPAMSKNNKIAYRPTLRYMLLNNILYKRIISHYQTNLTHSLLFITCIHFYYTIYSR